MMNPQDDRSNRNRWLLGGATGLGIAACIVGILLINRPADIAGPMVPATVPTVTATTMPGDGTEGTMAPIDISAPPSTDADPATTDDSLPATPGPTTEPVPTTTTSEPPPGNRFVTIVTAGEEGVRLDGAVITTDAMASAFAVPDGRVFMQRAQYDPEDLASTALLVVRPGSGTPEALSVPPELDTGLVLHDAAAVDGEVVLVVETRPPLCDAPDPCSGAIWAFRPDTGELDQLQEKNVWEGGWSRLTLANTGVIVGTETESATHWATSLVVPRSGAEPVDLALLGIDEMYGDCSDCPNGFGIDPRGGFVSWIENDLETFQTTLTVAALDGRSVRIPLIDRPGDAGGGTVCCLDGVGNALPLTPSVVTLDATIDGEFPTGRAIVNEESLTERRPPLPVNDLSEGYVSEVQTEYYDAGT